MNELLKVENLKKHYEKKVGLVNNRLCITRAVNGVSFFIGTGETVGLVGESGCGKTTIGKMIVDLVRPTSGQIFFNGKNLSDSHKTRAERLYFKRNIQMIFQDSYASLDPRMTAGESVAEALDIHKICANKRQQQVYLEQVFADVSLTPEQIDRYPHEFSGGQRQRIGIARAICLKPKVIVCDEPVSALDVSVQAQIINNMVTIQKAYGISYLFISHDLGVVKHISNRVIVMYLGFVLEEASKTEIFRNPLHPYTKALLEATPSTDPDTNKCNKPALKNEIDTSLIGVCCPFANRCDAVMEQCWKHSPQQTEPSPGHRVMCHLYSPTL